MMDAETHEYVERPDDTFIARALGELSDVGTSVKADVPLVAEKCATDAGDEDRGLHGTFRTVGHRQTSTGSAAASDR
jgi:hypothetical protein